DRVRRALGDRALRVEHIGSTAVPGLAAKPIVDMLVAVADPAEDSIEAAFVSAGYRLRVREPSHRMFRTPKLDVHIHVWAEGDAEVGRHLRFRDRLRRSAPDRIAYEQLKRQLATRGWRDMNEYAAAKGPLIDSILAADPER
ncbi:MAG: GrpB family protein, partial [Solirubrobacteraceae bacterium]